MRSIIQHHHVSHVYWFTWFDVQRGCMPLCSNRDRIQTVKQKEISHWCPIYVRRGERKWNGRSTQSTNGQQSHVQRHKSCIWITPPFLALSGRMIWTKNLSLSIWTFPLSFPQPLWWIIQKRGAWNETRRDGGLLRIEHAAVSPSPISAQQRGTLIRLHGWFRMSPLTVYHSLAAPPGAVGPSTLGLGHARKSGGGSGYQEVSGSKDVEPGT